MTEVAEISLIIIWSTPFYEQSLAGEKLNEMAKIVCNIDDATTVTSKRCFPINDEYNIRYYIIINTKESIDTKIKEVYESMNINAVIDKLH
jgi:hypothetical protein